MIILDALIGQTVVTVILGLLGFVVAIVLLIYFKAFLSKIFNIRYVDRRGNTRIDTDAFDNINEFVGEKISSVTQTVKSTITTLQHPNDNYILEADLIVPGKSIGNIYLSDTIAKAISQYGDEYRIIKHGSYSIEYSYAIFGISFYTKVGDTNQKIFSIKLFPPAKAKTRKGIQLIQSTLNHVIEIYGKPEFTTTQGSDLWNANYRGIQFSFQRDATLPKFPFNEQAHRNKKIIEISVIK